MESASSALEVVKIPKCRIKTLSSGMLVIPYGNLDKVKDRAIEAIGKALAEKLYEFHKMEARILDNGLIEISSTLDIIVPETPDNPWPPKP